MTLMGMKRTTQRDIAAKVGVGRSTVTLALQDHPRIAPETRRRIQEVARELGYSPDPFLAGLASYRNRQRTAAFHGTIAWLVNFEDGPYPWKKYPHYLLYFQGASRRALHHGYQLEEIHLNEKGLSPARMAGILHARNITGVLLCPQPKAEMEVDFAWHEFSAVTFGYSLLKPSFHTVAAAHFLNTRNAMQALIRRGYRRIGMVIDEDINRRCGHNVQAGYLIEQTLLGGKKGAGQIPVEPLFDYDSRRGPNATDSRNLVRYIERQQLDAILTSDYRILENLTAAGISAPDDIGVAGISLPVGEGPLSGVVEDSEQVGALAVDLLVGMMQHRERGVPPAPTRTHLEGIWHEGRTLRPAP
ncbi:LacI family transcription regulator [Opitutaceae bacterium TAV5]|nr:LacI family transcription regulator [Opitutaceae bacterium TAV5]